MKSLLVALQFLSIIPVRIEGSIVPATIGRSVGAYPAAGLVLGGGTALAGILALSIFPANVAAAVVLSTLVALSGGFHLDGLADTMDALAVKSSGDPAADRGRRLAVMKDGASGPAGVTALVLCLLLKFVALAYLMSAAAGAPLLLACVVALMPVYGRWAMVPAAVFGTAARDEGLGAQVIGGAGMREMALGLATVIVVLGGLFLVLPENFVSRGFLALLLVLVPGLHVLSVLFRRIADRTFGGLTGDVFGALGETGEVLYLLALSAWFRLNG